MTVLRTLFIGLLFLSPLACGVSQPGTVPLASPCIKNADCMAGICSDGICVLGADRACEPEQRRCNGDFIEECRETGDGWQRVRECETGCSDGACKSRVCNPGDSRCEGNLIMQCLANGSGWTLLQSCPTTCDPLTLSCQSPQCTPFETRCAADGSNVLQTCNSRGSGWTSSPCDSEGQDAVCDSGRCLPRACTTLFENGVATDREERCRGDVLEQCNDSQSGFEAVKICEFGCSQAGFAASCMDQVCSPGERRCEQHSLSACSPSGRGFEHLRFCPSGCEEVSGSAECIPPTCAAYARRCADADSGPIVEQCRADGTGYEALEACAQSCIAGSCVLSEAGCTPGDWRCNGKEVEQCVRAENGATQWLYVESCLGSCNAGACDTSGSCGCEGGTELEGAPACGSPARRPIKLHAMTGSHEELPADGVSSFLIYSEPIVDTYGRPIPDGTLITFAHDGSESLLLSPDADPGLPGLQRPSVGGIAKILLQAPSAEGELKITASGALRCKGELELDFVSPSGLENNPVFMAEDFSTTRNQDRAASTSGWDRSMGRLRSSPPFSFGTGADGDLVVNSHQTFQLWSGPERFASGQDVHALTEREAQLAGNFPGLSPGDEVLLIGVGGSEVNAIGVYEFKQVESIEGSRIRFTEKVEKLYGPLTNANLGDQRVVLQRVPNFRNVLVETSAVLTTTGLSQGGSGVLAFRASGTVRVKGRIHADNLGLPVTKAQHAQSSASLSRLFGGSGGPGLPGGGVVFIAAQHLTVREAGDQSPAMGEISASSRLGVNPPNPSSGGAGMVWLQAGDMNLAALGAKAQGQSGYTQGRIRLDYGRLAGGSGVAPSTPAAYVGDEDGVLVSSKAVFSPDSGTIDAQHLLGTLGRHGQSVFAGPPPSGSGLIFRSLNDDDEWETLSPQFSSADEFRFQIELRNLSDQPLELQGASWLLELSEQP